MRVTLVGWFGGLGVVIGVLESLLGGIGVIGLKAMLLKSYKKAIYVIIITTVKRLTETLVFKH